MREAREPGLKLGGGVARDVPTGGGSGGVAAYATGKARPAVAPAEGTIPRPFQAGGMGPRWASASTASTPIADRSENKPPTAAMGWLGGWGPEGGAD